MFTRPLRTVLAFAVALSFSINAFADVPAFDTSRMDRSVSPCNDFFST